MVPIPFRDGSQIVRGAKVNRSFWAAKDNESSCKSTLRTHSVRDDRAGHCLCRRLARLSIDAAVHFVELCYINVFRVSSAPGTRPRFNGMSYDRLRLQRMRV